MSSKKPPYRPKRKLNFKITDFLPKDTDVTHTCSREEAKRLIDEWFDNANARLYQQTGKSHPWTAGKGEAGLAVHITTSEADKDDPNGFWPCGATPEGE